MKQPRLGDRVGNYLLDEQIGAGSFSVVWRAHHHVFGEPVAIKIPTDSSYVRYLQRDGAVIHGLRHPNVVRALDLDPYGDPPYLVMELVDGPSLGQVIKVNPQGLSLITAMPVMAGLLSALDAAHRANVLHRDIKPGNILLASRNFDHLASSQVKIADFGLGGQAERGAGEMLQSGSMALEEGSRISGTLAYMSPEQREGRAVDARTDLYSAGVVLHEMLTGILPQGADSPSQLRPDLPRWIDEFFQRCYTRRERRFESASQMLQLIGRHWRGSHAHNGGIVRFGRGVRQVGGTHICLNCRSVVEPRDQFCIHCGRQLVDEVPRCPSCHAFVDRDDRFCILCGSDLRQGIGQTV